LHLSAQVNAMHIHASSMNLNPANLQMIAAEKAAAAQRAADVRRKLRTSALRIEAESGGDAPPSSDGRTPQGYRSALQSARDEAAVPFSFYV
jgi:hypothetical protein